MALLGYLDSRKARIDSKEALIKASTEQIQIIAARLNEDYKTKLTQSFEPAGHSRSSIIYMQVFWDVTIVNNGERDISIIDYTVRPIDLPYMNYDQGLFEYETNDSVSLPILLEHGHARRLKLKSFLVIPGHAPNQIRKLLHKDKRFGVTTLADVLGRTLYPNGIDFLGNNIGVTGPHGYDLLDEKEPINQRLKLTVISGRGTTAITQLKWYREYPECKAWPLES